METADARAYLEDLIRKATDYGYILAGVKTGIFNALGQAGCTGISSAELAATLGYRDDHLRIWCETAFAIGVLDDAGAGHFRLADGFEALLVSGPPPASLAGAIAVHEPYMRERLDLATVLQTGEERPRSEAPMSRERAAALLPLLRAQAQARTERVYVRIPAVADRLRQGAYVLDVGCGTGAQLESLAQAFPTATFVGIDIAAPVLEVARDLIAAAGLDDRVTLRQQGAEELTDEEAFDMVTMNVVLHELPPDHPATGRSRDVPDAAPGRGAHQQ